MRRALLCSPILMLPIFWLFLSVVVLFRDGGEISMSEFGIALLLYSPFILGFGYGLQRALVWLGKKRGLAGFSPPLRPHGAVAAYHSHRLSCVR